MVQHHRDLNRSFDGLPTCLAGRWRIVIDSLVVYAKDVSDQTHLAMASGKQLQINKILNAANEQVVV